MKIMILVNKDFEYAGYRSGVEYRITAGKTPNLHIIQRDYSTGPKKYVPSCIYTIGDKKHEVREFCIQYLFGENENSSNSEKKHEHLIDLIKKEEPDFIISVSTSESTIESQGGQSDKHSVNGSVILGNTFYAHDCREKEKGQPSQLDVDEKWARSDVVINKAFYNNLETVKKDIENDMICAPNKPCKKPTILYGFDNVSLGVINIITYSNYRDADRETYQAFKEQQIKGIPAGLETTHAVIRMALNKVFRERDKKIPVLFVSPIVDRYECFDDDVDKEGKQNKWVSYNAGVVVSSILEKVFTIYNIR